MGYGGKGKRGAFVKHVLTSKGQGKERSGANKNKAAQTGVGGVTLMAGGEKKERGSCKSRIVQAAELGKKEGLTERGTERLTLYAVQKKENQCRLLYGGKEKLCTEGFLRKKRFDRGEGSGAIRGVQGQLLTGSRKGWGKRKWECDDPDSEAKGKLRIET